MKVGLLGMSLHHGLQHRESRVQVSPFQPGLTSDAVHVCLETIEADAVGEVRERPPIARPRCDHRKTSTGWSVLPRTGPTPARNWSPVRWLGGTSRSSYARRR